MSLLLWTNAYQGQNWDHCLQGYTSLFNSLGNFVCGIRSCSQTGGNCQSPSAWSPAEHSAALGAPSHCSVCSPHHAPLKQSTNRAPHSWGHVVPLGAKASFFLPNKVYCIAAVNQPYHAGSVVCHCLSLLFNGTFPLWIGRHFWITMKSYHWKIIKASLVAQTVKASAYNVGGPWVQSLGQEDPLE